MTARDVIARQHAEVVTGFPLDDLCQEDAASMYLYADAILAALSAAGLAVVPREASWEMAKACLHRGIDEPNLYAGIWRAMVAAAEAK